MDLKLLQRFLPYAVIAFVTAFLLWFLGSLRFRGKTERINNSEDGDEAEVSSIGGSEFEVFLSFRGEDTRNGFTGHLYDSLQEERGVSTFIDSYKLEKGEKIDKLLEYIEKSKICILIISKRYAESKWCLKEVTKCLECNKEIIPVFFGVEPSDVRNQSGPFKYAFKRHESNKKLKPEEVRKWREALMKVGDTSGFNLKDMNGDEVKLKHAVIDRILSTVNKKPLAVAKHPIGLETRVEDVKKIIGNYGHEVHLIGIHGMGGLGKTTIAKAVYNDLAKGFDSASCFLSNIREKSESPNGLVDLQKQLIGDILKEKNISLSDVSGGQSLIKERAKSKRVLLVLDDVDSEEQLEALAGGRDWFGSGSVIIITTRDKEVLLAHKVKEEEIYKPQMLDEVQSLELFILHAFDGVQPQGEYVQLAKQVAAAAGGLPLTIKVIGSLLSSKKNVQEWEYILEKVEKVPSKKVQQTLKISYDSLSNYQKEIFLDISHFFIGEGRSYATYMWEGLGWHPKTAIPVLEQRSLITIDEETGEFEMHDQIRDMGRELVGGESSEAPEKDTRFTLERNCLDLLRPGIVGTKDAEAIQVTGGWNDPMSLDVSCNIGCFADISRLRMLQLYHVTLKGEHERFPRNLRWLQCRLRDLECLPGCLHLDNTVILHLNDSSIVRLWDGQKVFHQLKVLNLNGCTRLAVCPDFTSMPHLEILNFGSCYNMKELDPSIGQLKGLSDLCLTHCESLEELPEQIYELTSLQKLDLSYCDKITALPRQSGDSSSSSEQHVLGKLEVLLFDYCPKLTGCPDFMKTPNLKRLSFHACEKMREIDPSIGHLERLIRMDLSECSSLMELPQEIGRLTSLGELNLSYCSRISSLPESIGRLKQLNSLDLSYCSQISSLPASIVSLDQLQSLSISACKLLKSLPPLPPSLIRLHASDCRQLKSVGDISNVKGLQKLDLSGCERLLDVAGIEQLKFLVSLKLEGCSSLPDSILERVKNLDKLKELRLNDCESITKSRHFTSNMTDLRELDFTSNMTELDPSIRHLKGLTRLRLSNCRSLMEVPEEVFQLTSLEELDLSDCSSLREVPESICLLLHLQVLDVSKCTSLASLPNSLGNLNSLSRLNASGCASLSSLPDSLGNLKSLTELNASGCTSLASLPDSLGNLNSLRELNASGCTSLASLPDSLGNLNRMWKLNISGCTSLASLPDSLGNLNSLYLLNASGCASLASLPDSLGNLKTLSYLHLTVTAIEQLPDSIIQLEKLHFLSVAGCNNLRFLPPLPPSVRRLDASGCRNLGDILGIEQLTGLELLYLGGCIRLDNSFSERLGVLDELQTLHLRNCESLTKSPHFTRNMTDLRGLDFSDCVSMAEVDPSIRHLKALTHLRLNNCKSLKEVPEEVFQLTSLEEVDLSGCSSLRAVPESICLLLHLQVLNASACTSLASLPNSLGNLKKLTELDLSGTAIEQLPDSICLILHLEKLDASGCASLASLPNSLGNLKNLWKLNASGCTGLASLPNSLGHLKSLTELNVSGCTSLASLPDSLGNLKILMELNASGCTSLASLPDSLSNLKNLTKLNASGCASLASLPDSLGNLNSLRQLNASGCTGLASLPNSLGNLKRLRELQLKETAIEQLPDSIIQLENLDYLSVACCNNLEFLPPLPPSVTILIAMGCGKLLDIAGIEQLTGLKLLFLGGCIKLEDSLLERVESVFLNNEGLERFSIPGRLMEGGSSYPQSISFPLPKHLRGTVLYLYVDESSLNNIKTEIEDRSQEESMGYVARLHFSINDVQFSFSASFDYYSYDIPTALFSCEEVMKKVAEADVNRTGMMKMQVSVHGCTLLHADLFSIYPDDPDQPDDFKRLLGESGDNVVKGDQEISPFHLILLVA
ncbi:unnamed protein product [Victoria cruziana]